MKQTKKILIALCFVVLLLTLCFVGILVMEEQKQPEKKKEPKEEEVIWNEGLSVENLKLEFLSKKTLQEVVPKNIVIEENASFDTTSLGTKEIEFFYQIDGNGKRKNGRISYEIVDTTKPIILGTPSCTITLGSKLDIKQLFISGDLCDDSPSRTIEGKYNLNQIGNYPVTYVVKDKSGNTAKYNFTLKVVKKDSSGGGTTTTTTTSFQSVINQHKTKNTKIGIDVSKWQGDINWEKVKNAGCEFVLMRIGHQNGIGGEYIVDPYFKKNLEGAKKVGLPVGVYFYSYANSIDEAEKQANWIIKQLAGEKLELGISYDWESFSLYNSIDLSLYHFNLAKEKFLSVVHEAGYKGMLYSSKYYLENIWMESNYDTWLAHYTNQTNYKGNYFIWQKCNNGRISGINGDVDIDVMYVNQELYKEGE